MTWRRFLILLRGLSAQSATAMTLAHRHVVGTEHVRWLHSPEAIQRYAEAQGGIARKHPLD
jgi:hypothetical protein